MTTGIKADTLRSYGLSEDAIEEIIGSIESEFGRLALRSVSENIIVDQSTGRIRVLNHAESEYRNLFARAGMNIKERLGSRNAFFKAFRRANSVALDDLIQPDHELPFLK